MQALPQTDNLSPDIESTFEDLEYLEISLEEKENLRDMTPLLMVDESTYEADLVKSQDFQLANSEPVTMF